jgi:hypothetical protein
MVSHSHILQTKKNHPHGGLSLFKRVMGIEPTLSAWKAEVLPLNYTRTTKVLNKIWSGRHDLNMRPPAPKAGALPS